MNKENLMEDTPTFGRVLILIFFFILIFVMLWFATNIIDPVLKSNAEFYLWLGGLGLIITAFGFIAKKTGADFDVPLFSRDTSFGKLSNRGIIIMLLFVIIIGIVIMFNIGARGVTAAIYTAPTFQIVELGPGGSGIVSFIAGMFEELTIICVGFGISYFLLYHYTKNQALSLILTVIIISLLFGVAYHILRYGFTDVYGMIAVTIMGFISTIWIAIMKNPFLGMSFHGFNNFAITVVQGGWTIQNMLFFFLPFIFIFGIMIMLKMFVFKGDFNG